MRIQEMRSGLSHLKKKGDDERGKDYFEMHSILEHALAPDALTEGPAYASELEAPFWAVVSFKKKEASGLTYAQAAETMTTLDAAGVSGLCIVTDLAAERVGS
jgi:hypothetical protein